MKKTIRKNNKKFTRQMIIEEYSLIKEVGLIINNAFHQWLTIRRFDLNYSYTCFEIFIKTDENIWFKLRGRNRNSAPY